MKKKQEKTSSLEKLSLKVRGANIAVVISGERFAKRVTKEEREDIVKALEAYNASVDKNHKERTLEIRLNKLKNLVTKNKAASNKRKEELTETKTALMRKRRKEEKKVSEKKVTKPVAKKGRSWRDEY